MVALAPATPPAVLDGASVMTDLGYLAPMVLVAAWSLLLLVADAYSGPGVRAFQRRLGLVGLGLAALVAALQFGQWQFDAGVPVFQGFLVVDQFSLILDLGVLAVAAGVLMFAGDYARTHRFEYGEQEALVLIATFGMMILVHANDLLALFLGIETMSITVYVLVGARWNSKRSPEAALKYFLMGAFSSGVLLMGIALLYGATGTTSLQELSLEVGRVFHEWRSAQLPTRLALRPDLVPADALANARDSAIVGFAPAALLIPGVFLALAALLFKASAVPFHMWTPDAYDGAPTPTTGLMAAAVKIGAFAALLKLMVGALHIRTLVVEPYGWTSVVALVAFLTMTVGNLAAVRQNSVKRLLAYSSVAHVGYLLVGVVAAASFYGQGAGFGRGSELGTWAMATGDLAVASVVYYLLTYGIATLGCFACVAWYGTSAGEGGSVHQWAGLAQRHPGMALGMTVCLLSLLGMPPAAGFIGKVAVFRAALENDNFVLRLLVVAAVVNSVIGAYYYLRLIVAMYFQPRPETEVRVMDSSGARAVVAIAAAASLALGIGAGAVMRRAHLASRGFVLPVGSEMRADWVDQLRARWETEDRGTLPTPVELAEDAIVPARAEPAPPQAGGGRPAEAAP